MDVQYAHKHWIEVFEKLLGEKQKNFKDSSRLLHCSKRFLQLVSIGGTSATYNSYVERVRASIETILCVLVAHIENAETHQGIYEILDNYKMLQHTPNIEKVLKHYVEGSATVHVVWSATKIVEKFSVPEWEIPLLKKAEHLGGDKEYLVGEGAVRLALAVYLKTTAHKVQAMQVLSALFKTKYLDLYVSRVYPSFIKHETEEFSIKLLGALLKIDALPVFCVAQHMSASALSQLPQSMLETLKAKVQNTPSKHEAVASFGVLAKCPALMKAPEILKMFNRAAPSSDMLYEQSAFLVSQAERASFKQELETHREELCTFLDALKEGTDGTRIQQCRLLFFLHIPEYTPVLMSFVSSKNIRVKWNALRALSVYALSVEDIQTLLLVFQKTPYDKIKLWVLHNIESNAERLLCSSLCSSLCLVLANTPTAADSQYKEEIDKSLNRLKEVFFFNGRSR
ncbi:hypothetical protein NECID01_0823 [Nematocida sp. AWRm77]|nr:hypothetical protein NECID01_0823 [Nematocida sp. AWRm77]